MALFCALPDEWENAAPLPEETADRWSMGVTVLVSFAIVFSLGALSPCSRGLFCHDCY